MVWGRDIQGATPQKPGIHKKTLKSNFERKFSEIPLKSRNFMKSHIPRGLCTTGISPKPFEFLSPFRPGGGGTRKSQNWSKKRGKGWKFCHFTPFPPISTHWHPFCLQAGSVAPRLANPTKTQRKINTSAAAWGAQFAQKRENGAFPWNSVVYGKNNHFSAKV